MLLYLLLIFIFGIIVLASLGVFIFGFIKKRRNLIVIASILFGIGTLGCALSAFTYTKKVVNYVKSEEFQDDANKGSALVGETIGSISSGVSEGLATRLDDDAIAKLASKSAGILGKSIKTIGAGIDSTLGNKIIFLDSSLANSGLEPGRAEEQNRSGNVALGVFIDYKKDFKGKLSITNYDQSGIKIDVAEKEISAKAGQGKVEVFDFPFSDFGFTTYYIISKTD